MPGWNVLTISAVAGAGAIVFMMIIVALVHWAGKKHAFSNSKKENEIKNKSQNKEKQKASKKTSDKIVLTIVKKNGCPGCEALKPTLKSIEQSGIKLYKIEGPSKTMSWHRQNNVSHYPTVCTYNISSDQIVDHFPRNMQRTKDNILQFARDKKVL